MAPVVDGERASTPGGIDLSKEIFGRPQIERGIP